MRVQSGRGLTQHRFDDTIVSFLRGNHGKSSDRKIVDPARVLLTTPLRPSRESLRAHLHLVGMLRFFFFSTNQPSLPIPFHSVLVFIFVLRALSMVFHSKTFSRQLSAFSLCSSGLNSALLILSTKYLLMKVSPAMT